MDRERLEVCVCVRVRLYAYLCGPAYAYYIRRRARCDNIVACVRRVTVTKHMFFPVANYTWDTETWIYKPHGECGLRIRKHANLDPHAARKCVILDMATHVSFWNNSTTPAHH